MIAEGNTGRKGKGGFYRMTKAGRERVLEAIDLSTGEYRPAAKPKLQAVEATRRDLGALVRHPSPAGEYAQAVLVQVLAYAASLVPDIADDIASVDEAMSSMRRCGSATLGPRGRSS
jgi:3-hydroxyacyl-CoA dehydrogenase